MTIRAVQSCFRFLCLSILLLAIIELVWSHPARSAEEAAAPDASAANAVTDATVSQELEGKRLSLETRSRELDDQEARIKDREKDLDAKLKEMEHLRQAVVGELEAQKKNNEERVAKLVAVFETMTPKSASAVFETLDDWLAVEVLKRMDIKRVAKVMNLMDKNRSAKLSEMLTGYYHPESDRKVASANVAGQAGTSAVVKPATPQSPQKSQKKGGE